MRANQRLFNATRPIKLTKNFTKYGEGSVLVEFGDTKVICTASVSVGVPPFLKGTGSGWVTAEYGMIPRSTNERMLRGAAKGKQTGRTQEIQRLIGRSLRAAVDLKLMGENTIVVDCDVIQADGGTRTASITGGCIALFDAIKSMQQKELISTQPFLQLVASISVGMYQGQPVLDLDYIEDSSADTDLNVVMNERQEFIELQGTAERRTFAQSDLHKMLDLADKGIRELIQIQKRCIAS